MESPAFYHPYEKSAFGLSFRFFFYILQYNYNLMDRRGRRSLQGEIKLPYENHPFASAFSYGVRYGVQNPNVRIMQYRVLDTMRTL